MVKKGSKKSKNKKKRESEELKEEISEVDKEYYQILINDLQGQVSKLTERCQELETQNEDTQNDYKQLDEDRADIISFLRRQLKERTAESNELQERLTGLKQARSAEAEEYESRIATMQREATIAHELLSGELKLLQGKLNSLEEFRAQRDDLMAKFEHQEQQMRDREQDHQKSLHDVERNFIISKDRLKREMEQQLLKLSTEFQAATTTRMAATTQRAVRENVALLTEVSKLRKESLLMRESISQYENRITELKRELLLMKSIIRCNNKSTMRQVPMQQHAYSQTDADNTQVSLISEYKVVTSSSSQRGSHSTSCEVDEYDSSTASESATYKPGQLGFVS